MITGLSKRHNGEKGAIHYRKTDIPDLIAGFAENDLAQFIFQSEILSLCALYFPQDLIHRSIGGIQDKGSPVDLLFSFVKCRHLITVRLLFDLRDLPSEMQLYAGIFCNLLHEVIPQNMGIVRIFLRQERSVTQARLKILFHRKRFAGDPRILAEFAELSCVCPGKMAGSRVDLLKLRMNTEGIVLHKTLEIPR